MNIFIDEFGTIFCEFTKGVYSPVSYDYFKELKEKGLIENIEFCTGVKDE